MPTESSKRNFYLTLVTFIGKIMVCHGVGLVPTKGIAVNS